MVILIVVLHVIVCVFLIAVILLQAGRGQGLSWGVFGGNPQSILGTKTASFLSRVTTGCAIIFLFTVISLNILETRKSRSLIVPQRPISKLDFSKIKAALEEAEKTKAANGPTAAAPEIPKDAAAAAASVAQAVPAPPATQTQPEKTSVPDALPLPPEKH